MGREVKRVPLDFDWPIGRIWLGYMAGVCSDDVDYITGHKLNDGEKSCDICRHAAKLAGVGITDYGCPQWQREPPTGEGWQMWETVSEGGPISPVLRTPEELARWLADNNASACGSQTEDYEAWLSMIKKGWAPSMFVENGKIKSGVKGISEEKEK